jgi:uncharacterized membrane protein HdeD (DUF308 family)
MMQSVITSASKLWPTFVWRGVFALILAAIAFAYPGQTATVVAYAFGAYILLSGFALLAAGFGFSALRGPWLALEILGLLSIIAGIAMLAEPGIGALTLAYTIALWAIAAGVLEIFAAVLARDAVSNTWLWVAAGIVSIAAGVLIAYAPGRGLLALSYTVGVYATLAGIASIAFGVRLRGLPGELGQSAASGRISAPSNR